MRSSHRACVPCRTRARAATARAAPILPAVHLRVGLGSTASDQHGAAGSAPSLEPSAAVAAGSAADLQYRSGLRCAHRGAVLQLEQRLNWKVSASSAQRRSCELAQVVVEPRRPCGRVRERCPQEPGFGQLGDRGTGSSADLAFCTSWRALPVEEILRSDLDHRELEVERDELQHSCRENLSAGICASMGLRAAGLARASARRPAAGPRRPGGA